MIVWMTGSTFQDAWDDFDRCLDPGECMCYDWKQAFKKVLD